MGVLFILSILFILSKKGRELTAESRPCRLPLPTTPRRAMRPSATRALCALSLVPVVLTACSAAAWRNAGRAVGEAIRTAATTPPAAAALPRTRAERTDYRETSRYDDVVRFLDSLQALGAPMRVGVMGKSTEGRDLLYVVASRPLVASAEEARRLGRPVVYVQANIHAGEVEGKEALQALLRDLLFDARPNALDSIVLVAVPVYNADGNERFAPQAVNRYEQNGPELVGERANGQKLDLNRDYVKAEAPETRASLRMFDAWDPDVFVDLHTTDGSYHGYALTYSPSLNPAAPLGAYTRDTLLPELRRRVKARRGFETFDYGNFDSVYEEKDITDSVKQGWYTYDHRPRFGTNYYGLRNRVAVLSEAFSHDPFERRVKSTYAFVAELLSLAAERGGDIAARERAIATGRAGVGHASSASAPAAADVPIRARVAEGYVGDVLVERLVHTGDSARTEPGVPRGVRRTGRVYAQRMPVYDRFAPTLAIALPAGGWALDAGQQAAVDLLREHGVVVERLASDAPAAVAVDVFEVDSAVRAVRPFQGHNEVTLGGHWRRTQRVLTAGAFVVPADQPLAVLAAYLLEPESDDGLATWNVLDPSIRAGGDYPVMRVQGELRGARRIVR